MVHCAADGRSSPQPQRERHDKTITGPETPDHTAETCPPKTPVPTERTGGESRSRKRKDSSLGRNAGRREEEEEGEKSPGRSHCTSARLHRISPKSLQEVENKLAFGREMLPAFRKSPPSSSSSWTSLPASLYLPSPSPSSLFGCQAGEIGGRHCEPNLGFLPQIDKWLFVSLREADFYYCRKKYTMAASHLNTTLQLCSSGCVFEDLLCWDVEDIDLVISYIQARLAVCYLKMRRPDLALSHAHRSIQLNPSHFQNHLRQAVAYRMLGDPCSAAKSVLTADWLYCLLGGTERRISTQLKLYWQAMLEEALTMEEDVSVMFTPYTGHPTAEDVSRAEDAFRKQHPAFTSFIYTDPKGGHLLPQTTDWLSAALPQLYLLTLGFRRREDGLFLQKLHARTWPSLTDEGGAGKLLNPECRWENEAEIQKLCDSYRRRILPILDLMQATQINACVCVGSGLIERLQYSSMLGKLGIHREHSSILRRCQAQLATAPYLQEVDAHQASTPLQALLTDIMDELGGGRRDAERVWNKMLKVGWWEDVMYTLEKRFLEKKAQRHRCRQRNTEKDKVKKRSNKPMAFVPTPADEHKAANSIAPSADSPPPASTQPSEDSTTENAAPNERPSMQIPPSEDEQSKSQ